MKLFRKSSQFKLMIFVDSQPLWKLNLRLTRRQPVSPICVTIFQTVHRCLRFYLVWNSFQGAKLSRRQRVHPPRQRKRVAGLPNGPATGRNLRGRFRLPRMFSSDQPIHHDEIVLTLKSLRTTCANRVYLQPYVDCFRAKPQKIKRKRSVCEEVSLLHFWLEKKLAARLAFFSFHITNLHIPRKRWISNFLNALQRRSTVTITQLKWTKLKKTIKTQNRTYIFNFKVVLLLLNCSNRTKWRLTPMLVAENVLSQMTNVHLKRSNWDHWHQLASPRLTRRLDKYGMDSHKRSRYSINETNKWNAQNQTQ
jgi:hypothetical protein